MEVASAPSPEKDGEARSLRKDEGANSCRLLTSIGGTAREADADAATGIALSDTRAETTTTSRHHAGKEGAAITPPRARGKEREEKGKRKEGRKGSPSAATQPGVVTERELRKIEDEWEKEAVAWRAGSCHQYDGRLSLPAAKPKGRRKHSRDLEREGLRWGMGLEGGSGGGGGSGVPTLETHLGGPNGKPASGPPPKAAKPPPLREASRFFLAGLGEIISSHRSPERAERRKQEKKKRRGKEEVHLAHRRWINRMQNG
nr:PREDICTED: uncharacterized protein LOC105679302 [Linepithema humile]